MADARDPVLLDDYAKRIKDSDELHNINCYEYLLNLFNALPEQSTLRFTALENFYITFEKHKTYDSNYAYGNLYVTFLNDFEIEIQQALNNLHSNALTVDEKQKLTSMLNNAGGLISAIYTNANRSLERTGLMIQGVTDHIHHTSPASIRKVNERLKSDSSFDVNATNPYRTGSLFGVAQAYSNALSPFGTYKPQATSLPAVRTYTYKAGTSYPTELRFGTQGQYENRTARVSPLFHAWLIVQQMQSTGLHVYINNLRLDNAGKIDSIKDIEIPLSKELHKLEQHHPDIAVITLPADKGLMSKKMLYAHERKYSYSDAFNKMLHVAIEKSDEKIKDFYISDKVKSMLYGVAANNSYDKNSELDHVRALLTNSFIKLGFDSNSTLSPAQFHAVYFHFIKFEMTNFILASLRPNSFNMTCKDAIDRGGVSSAYYNLITSIEKNHPMTQDEFIRALHAAPAMVKGRGMNHHVVALWNAINAYIDAHPDMAANQSLAWLIEWRDNNVPENSKRYLQHEIHRYIVRRSGESESSGSLAGIPGSVKLQAANIIETLSRGVKYKNLTFQDQEWQAIHEGRLGKIVAKMVEHGLIDLSTYAPAIATQPISFRPSI